MVCYRPLQAFLLQDKRFAKKQVYFPTSKIREASDCVTNSKFEFASEIKLPCSICIGCRLEYARQWSVRCFHEASLYDRNCFITLTYDDDHLPSDRSLDKSHFQDFMKRLRSRYFRGRKSGIRYYHCGEYGEKLGRPHYHLLLFNFDFDDKVFWKQRRGYKYYISEELSKLWGKGFCTIGSVTIQSAGYVARYAMKKVVGKRAKEHYSWINENGEIIYRISEYATMSNGIGKGWYEKYKSDLYPSDFCMISNGKKIVRHKPPRYYDVLLDREDPELLSLLKERREEFAEARASHGTPSRLKVREECKRRCLERLFREYDSESADSLLLKDSFDYFSVVDI